MASKNRRLFELRLGKLGVVLFVCGMSLLLFSMFLFGVVVGKHMEAYPEKYAAGLADLIRQQLPALGWKAREQTEQGSRSQAAGGEDRFDLTFYDTLTGKKEGAGGAPPAGSQADPSRAVVPKTTAPAGETQPAGTVSAPPSAAAEESRGGRKEESAAAKKAEKPEIPPAPVQPKPGETAQGKGRYEVQAAAYRDRGSAEKLAKRILSLGFSSRVAAKELPGSGQWHRVIVGGFENRAKAQEAADKLAAKIGGLKCVIRPAGNGGN